MCIYSAFMFLYKAPAWALSIYPRLLMPVSPMLLDVYRPALPRNHALLAAWALLTIFFAYGSNLGFGTGLTTSGLIKFVRP